MAWPRFPNHFGLPFEPHPDDVAAVFGVPNNTVSQTKTRVERMIAEHEALLGE